MTYQRLLLKGIEYILMHEVTMWVFTGPASGNVVRSC